MRLLAVLAIIGGFSAFAFATAPAHAQYPPPTFSLVCEADVEISVAQGQGEVMVTVENTNGDPVSGQTVSFIANPGSVPLGLAITNAQGIATIVFDPTQFVGNITVTASLSDTSCQTQFQQQVLSTSVEEVAALPSTGTGGFNSGNSIPVWAQALLATIAVVTLGGVGRKVTNR